jgi:lysophospholipase L1-like esterase
MGALDISELNATENPHTLATYADLSAALAAIPSNDYKKGGMSIKFVQSSDNKYVQYRLMSDTFNITPANWQGVDNKPTAGSDNLVKSGGVANCVNSINAQINGYSIIPNAYLKASSLTPTPFVDDNYKLSVLIFKFKNEDEEQIQLNIYDGSRIAYCHFVDKDFNILSSIQGESGSPLITSANKPQGAAYLFATNYMVQNPYPIVEGTLNITHDISNLDWLVKGAYPEVTVNSYYPSNSTTPVAFVDNYYKLGTIVFEFINTQEEEVFIGVILASSVAYCHFLDAEKNILSSIAGVAKRYTEVIGKVIKPQGAKYIAVTNYFGMMPMPFVTKTINAVFYTDLIAKLDNIQGKEYPHPYIFDIDFIKGVIDDDIIEGSYTLTANGATISSGYSNKLGVKRWVSPTECAIFSDIVLTDVDSKICLSTIETEFGVQSHASVVVFDFENAKIIVYPKSKGESIPATALTEQVLTNISGNDYRIEFGRKNRNLYAAVTNNRTCERQEIVINEDDYNVVTQAYPAGWIRNYPYISVLAGGCYIQDIKGVVPTQDIVFLGDSITEGLYCAYDDCWCKLVMDALGSGINFGFSGGKVSKCQEIVDTILPYIHPKYVVVTVGTNGGNTLTNLTTLRDSIKTMGAVPIFNHIPMHNSNTSSINAVIDQLDCDGAKFDVATAINNNPTDGKNTSMYNTDGVHPNALGHAAMATRFLNDLSYLKYKL